MSIISTFARIVGVPERLAEDALHSERAARHTLTRRGMMGALAAMAAGSIMPLPTAPWRHITSQWITNGSTWSYASMTINGVTYALDFVGINYEDQLQIDVEKPALIVNGTVRIEGRLMSYQEENGVASSERGA